MYRFRQRLKHLVVRGLVWPCVVVSAWSCVVVHGRSWSLVRGRAWLFMVVRLLDRPLAAYCPVTDTGSDRNTVT